MSTEDNAARELELAFTRKLQNTYEHAVHCQNCGNSQRERIEKGTIALAHRWTCTKCGCTDEQVKQYWSGAGHLAGGIQAAPYPR